MTLAQIPDKPPDGGEASPAVRVSPAPARPELGAVRKRLAQAAGVGLPSRGRAKSEVKWWCTTGLRGLLVMALHVPYRGICELRPIGVGVGRIVTGWAGWCGAADYARRMDQGEHSKSDPDKLENRREGRRRLSLAVLIMLAITGWVLAVTLPQVLIVVGIVLVGMCDAVGRRNGAKPETLPVARAPLLREGVPLSQLTAEIVKSFEREGLPVEIAHPMRYDPDRQEYELKISCADEIRNEHIRAIERAIGAKDYAIHNLATDIATVRKLAIRDGDPLVVVPPPPWVESGTRTITQGLDLGASVTEVPFLLPAAGVHIRVVGGTGAGKTKWFLRALINALSACRDAEIWGIDITRGPELPLWRGVIQRKAFTPEDAEVLLDAALAEIARRARILTDIAEDDDPTNDCDEWHSGLGPALVVVIDEFSQLAEFDGRGDKLDLLGRTEQIVRTGRKHWVSLIMLTQKTGNNDFGSAVMSSQCGVSVMLACTPRDTVTMVGVERRDQGYAPHLLSPGVEGDPRDAGKCYLESPMHRTPDIYRCYSPMPNAEVKRRAMQRVADGLPHIHADSTVNPGEQVAVEVPAALALLDTAFSESDADRLPSAAVLELAATRGETWTAERLADALRPHHVETRKARADGRPVWCYFRADVQRALGAL